MPKVSVIVPNYNHAPYLERRFDSIFAQTYQDFELIILDDCSTDNSREVLEKYRNHPKVSQVVYNEKNSGSTFKQWNKGVAMAKGEFIWIAESDDEAEPEFLETLVPKLDANSNVGIAYCGSIIINEKSKSLGPHLDWTENLTPLKWEKEFISKGVDECAKDLLVKNIIPNASAALFRKNVFYNAGGAVISLKMCGDWITWFNMLKKSDLAYTPLLLNRYRFHINNVRTTTRFHKYCEEVIKVRCSFIKESFTNEKFLLEQILNYFQAAFYKNPEESNWPWAIRTLSGVINAAQPKCALKMLNIFAMHRIRYGFIGKIYRYIK